LRWLGQNDFATPQLPWSHLRKRSLCSIALVNLKNSRIAYIMNRPKMHEVFFFVM
jgi:hypothetical protein